eukprot:60498_1
MGNVSNANQLESPRDESCEINYKHIPSLKQLFSDARYCNFNNIAKRLRKLMEKENDSNLINKLRSPYGKSKQYLWMMILWKNTLADAFKKRDFIQKLEHEFTPNFNLTNNERCNVIHYLCMNPNSVDIDTSVLLLNHFVFHSKSIDKASFKSLDSLNRTPLHYAILSNKIECIALLLPFYDKYEVNHIKDKQGNTIADLAKAKPDLINILPRWSISKYYIDNIADYIQEDTPKQAQNIKHYCYGIGYGVKDNMFGSDDFVYSSNRKNKKFQELHGLQALEFTIDGVYVNGSTLMIKTAHNELYVCGDTRYGQSGLATDAESITQFTKVNLSAIELVSNGNADHSFILSANHELFASGRNPNGQLGNSLVDSSTENSKNILIKIDLGFLGTQRITKIACGAHHSVFLTNGGLVYGSGNLAGHSRDNRQQSTPILITSTDMQIIDAVAGGNHTLLIDKHQHLLGFGDNRFGQINDEEIASITEPKFHRYFKQNNIKIKSIACGSSHSLCIDINGICYFFGFKDIGHRYLTVFEPHKIRSDGCNDDHIDVASCGPDHNLLLSNKNEVIAFGDNRFNQCSALIETDNISSPHVLSKSQEIGINENDSIESVLAISYSSIIFVRKIEIAIVFGFWRIIRRNFTHDAYYNIQKEIVDIIWMYFN